MKKAAALLFLLVVWAGAANAADGVVSFNFENWGSVSQGEYAGVVEVANWNDSWLDGGNVSPMADLRDSTGEATSIDVSWVEGVWGIRQWDATASGADAAGTRNVSLMKGYLDKHAPELTSFTVTEIPYKYYDVYVYVMADVPNRTGNVTDGTTTYYFLTDPASLHFTEGGTADYMEFKEITATEAGDAVLSNYAVFPALSGDTLTIDCAITSGGGIAGFQIVEVGPPTGPREPVVTPDNGDGTVGDIVDMGGGVWQVQNVTLGFVAAGDPDEEHEPQYAINPNLVKHNIYLQTGAPNDPNLYLYDSIEETIVDPYTHDPNVSYGPLPANLLAQATTYEWQVEEVLINPDTSLPYADRDPNNIFSKVWSFTTVSATPRIESISDHTLTDASGNATLTITTGTIADNFRWFKVVGQQDSADGESDDVMLTDTGIYSTTTTRTLTLTGVASDGSDDAQYYAIAYNGVPGEPVTVESAPSATAWVWYPREVHRYTFESTYTADTGSFIEDTIGSSDIQLMSDDTGEDLASIDSSNPDAPGLAGSHSLYLNNPNANDPNIADGQYAQIGDPLVGAYKDITIAAWIYHKGGGWQRILSIGNNNGEGTGGDSLYFTPSGNATSGQLMLNINGQSITAPGGSVPENEWAYVTATLSGDTAKLYVNGEWVAVNNDFTNDPIDNTPTANNWIGRSQWYTWDTLFNGYIADLRVWNYGLTNAEVADAYMADDTNAAYVCDSENDDLSYDYNNNCLIDVGDLAVLVEAWLDSYRIYPD